MDGWTENDIELYNWIRRIEMKNKHNFSKNKYKVSPPDERRYNGRTYASKAEMEYAKELYMLKKGGEILEFIEQPRLWLGVPENVYVPDFFIVPNFPKSLNDMKYPYFVDVKGMMTVRFKQIIKLWRSYGTLDLHIIKKKGSRFVTSDIISAEKHKASSSDES